MQKINAAQPFVGGYDQHRARAIAEDHAGGAVGVVDDRRHNVGANDQDFFMRARFHKLHSGLQRIDKTGAGRGDIETPGAFCAQLVLHQAGGGGEQHVGSYGSDKDRLHLAGGPAASSQRFFGGLGREVGGSHAFIHDVPLANAGSLDDPLVVGVNHLFEIGVGQQSRRDVGSKG